MTLVQAARCPSFRLNAINNCRYASNASASNVQGKRTREAGVVETAKYMDRINRTNPVMLPVVMAPRSDPVIIANYLPVRTTWKPLFQQLRLRLTEFCVNKFANFNGRLEVKRSLSNKFLRRWAWTSGMKPDIRRIYINYCQVMASGNTSSLSSKISRSLLNQLEQKRRDFAAPDRHFIWTLHPLKGIKGLSHRIWTPEEPPVDVKVLCIRGMPSIAANDTKTTAGQVLVRFTSVQSLRASTSLGRSISGEAEQPRNIVQYFVAHGVPGPNGEMKWSLIRQVYPADKSEGSSSTLPDLTDATFALPTQ